MPNVSVSLFLVSVSASPQMYQQQYPGQGGGPGNGPSMQQHLQHHVGPRQNFYQPQHVRMAVPNQGPRMPHLANNSPRGPMIQGGPAQQGHNGPTEVGSPYPGGGNGHIPQAPPTGMPPNPQNQVGLNQQPPPQQPVYTFNVNQQQHAPIMMLHSPMQVSQSDFV